MAANVQILPIKAGSDGDANKRPASNLAFTRNDQYYLERVASEKWIKDLPGGGRPGVKYQLDRLPDGYAGFEKNRHGTSHVDRYLYGHPNGVFRSLNEFYPHFKQLMDNGHAIGCPCKLCTTGSSRKKTGGGGRNSDASASPIQQSPFFTQPQQSTTRATQAQHFDHLPQGRLQESSTSQPRRKQVDEEGTTDVYRKLIDKLKAARPEGKVDERIVESMSPDWRAGQDLLEETLEELKKSPMFAPRHGEVLLFMRNPGNDSLGWDSQSKTWRTIDPKCRWMDKPRWEAGVVTQTPTQAVTASDLAKAEKKASIIYTGYRIEPLPKPGSVTKTYTKQHCYVPLHAVRPLSMWHDCIGDAKNDRHPTVTHALTLSSSFSIVGKSHFKGVWPEATVFCNGVYIGHELILVGDVVRLAPRPREQRDDAITDVMVITSVKLKFVDLDSAGDDDYDDGRPYNTCLHISGKAYTMDPGRSYDGVGKMPIKPNYSGLPPGILDLGSWYHMLDPKKPKLRLEVPYHRVLGRCHEKAAIVSWYTPPSNISSPPSTTTFQAVNARASVKEIAAARYNDISHGFPGVRDARFFSLANDHRIMKESGGKSWFWADTRVEQLDLHEVNGKFVGIKDDNRGREQMEDWRKALKALDGKAGGLEEYHAVRKEREMQRVKKVAEGAAGMGTGILASAAETTSAGAEAGPTSTEDDAMELDQDSGDADQAMGVDKVMPKSSDESDVEMEDPQDALTAFKTVSERPAVQQKGTKFQQAAVISLLEESDDD